jgi:hypothetical protein
MTSQIYKSLFNLSEDIEIYILEFCIDKRLNWEKVSQQFFKGGFNRNNFNVARYIKNQKNLCKKYWLSTRPELRGDGQWDAQLKKDVPMKFIYMREWDTKKCTSIVSFTQRDGSIWNKWSGKKPVSKWLNCIKKFEKIKPEMAVEYLPEKRRRFGVKGVSKFYVKKRKKLELKKKRIENDKLAILFSRERYEIKLDVLRKKYGFTHNQNVLLSFSSNEFQGLRFYKGICNFEWHPYGKKLQGKKRFDSALVDSSMNISICVKFSDGETRFYTPEKLVDRIKRSKKEYEVQTELNINLLSVNTVALTDIEKYLNIKETKRYIHANTFTLCIMEKKYFKVSINNNDILFNEEGHLIGAYDKGVIQTNMGKYKICDGYITIDADSPTETIEGITYFKIPYGGFDDVLITMDGEIAGNLYLGHIMEMSFD